MQVSESHLWCGPGPPSAACAQWALCSAPCSGSQMETRGDTTLVTSDHGGHQGASLRWESGTLSIPVTPTHRAETPVTEDTDLQLHLLLCWRKRVRIRASHWQFGEVVRERREILIIASKYWLWYRAPPGLYICPQYWVSIFLHWESRSDSRDNAKWSTGPGREHTQEICATRMKYWLRVTGKGNVIRCWWIFSYMWSAWRMGSH